MKGFLALVVLLCSCGGKTCTVTISGAGSGIAGQLSGSYDCGLVDARLAGASNVGSFSFAAPLSSPDSSISVGIGLPAAPKTGRYQSSDAGASGDVMVLYTSGTFAQQWDATPACAPACSYDLSLSEVGSATLIKTYPVHGTLDATLVDSSRPPTTLTVHASF